MTDIYISNLCHSLGSREQSVEAAQSADQLLSNASALRAAGFHSHHICLEEETAYDLAASALAESSIDFNTVDAIVYSTCLPLNGSVGEFAEFRRSRDVKHLMQFPASELQSKFGMNAAFVIGLNQQACTGMLGALRIARNTLLAEPDINNILCITADRFPAGAIYEQAYNLISDGAGACLLSRTSGDFLLRRVHHLTNGAMVNASDDETAGSYFNYTCQLIQEALMKENLKMSDIRWVVPQNTNNKAWLVLSKLLQLSDEQTYHPSMQRVGHVISADNIINLAELKHSKDLKSGDKILTFMAGFGSNWQCAILEAA